MEPLVELRGVEQVFGSLVALHPIDLSIRAGEVLALLGDNGAGKSTLIKILTGFHQPRRGQMLFGGKPLRFSSPQQARALGIEAVYQDLALVPLLSIARNFFLGRELTARWGLLDLAAMHSQTCQALEEMGIQIRDPAAPVERLSGGERQAIAIGRAVHFGSRLLILDEPTSALSIGETLKVLGYMRRARDRGLAVLFITHNLHHVYEVADHIAVLSQGRKVGDCPRDQLTPDQAAQLIMEGGPPLR
jgi:simple sugar transport system ATP-binding protein